MQFLYFMQFLSPLETWKIHRCAPPLSPARPNNTCHGQVCGGKLRTKKIDEKTWYSEYRKYLEIYSSYVCIYYIYTNSNTVIDQLSILVGGRAKKQCFLCEIQLDPGFKRNVIHRKAHWEGLLFFSVPVPSREECPKSPKCPNIKPIWGKHSIII